jgi:hypothetical protein
MKPSQHNNLIRNPKTFLGNNVLEDYGVLRRRFWNG